MNLKMDYPTILTLEQWGKKYSIQLPNSDLDMQEMHEIWKSVVLAAGFAEKTIFDFYDEEE